MSVSMAIVALVESSKVDMVVKRVLELEGIKSAFVMNEIMMQFLKKKNVTFFTPSRGENQIQIMGIFADSNEFDKFHELLKGFDGVKNTKTGRVPSGYI